VRPNGGRQWQIPCRAGPSQENDSLKNASDLKPEAAFESTFASRRSAKSHSASMRPTQCQFSCASASPSSDTETQRAEAGRTGTQLLLNKVGRVAITPPGVTNGTRTDIQKWSDGCAQKARRVDRRPQAAFGVPESRVWRVPKRAVGNDTWRVACQQQLVCATDSAWPQTDS
jgi:hypothetical protein